MTLGAPGFASTARSSRIARLVIVPAAERSVARAWAAWSKRQRFNGRNAVEDYANPAQLNRLDWYSSTGWRRPYPGDRKILAPTQVPGRHLPSAGIGGG